MTLPGPRGVAGRSRPPADDIVSPLARRARALAWRPAFRAAPTRLQLAKLWQVASGQRRGFGSCCASRAGRRQARRRRKADLQRATTVPKRKMEANAPLPAPVPENCPGTASEAAGKAAACAGCPNQVCSFSFSSACRVG